MYVYRVTTSSVVTIKGGKLQARPWNLSTAAAAASEPRLTAQQCYETTGGDAFWIRLASGSVADEPRIAL